jgi:hypothetical protein
MALKGVGKVLRSRPRVHDDWMATLPPEKERVFSAALKFWDTYYGMLSVSLDEAFALRRQGKLPLARQQAAVSCQLMSILVGNLVAALREMTEQSAHLPVPPAVDPLNPSFFRSENARETASWNTLLFHVLFAERARFFHKLQSLLAVLEGVLEEFSETTAEISDGLSTQPYESWASLEVLHYDANTCLRETEVVFKSFIRVWPGRDPALFSRQITASLPASARPRTSRVAY